MSIRGAKGSYIDLCVPSGRYCHEFVLFVLEQKASPPNRVKGGLFLAQWTGTIPLGNPVEDTTSLGCRDVRRKDAGVLLMCYGCGLVLFSVNQKQAPLAADGRGALFEVLPSGCYLEASMETSMSIGRAGKRATGPSVLRECDIRKFAVSAVNQKASPSGQVEGLFSGVPVLTGATPKSLKETLMSLEHNDENRKALARRVKAMIKAARVLGYSVWEIAIYDENDKEKRAEVATLLAENLRNPGSLGAFIAQAQIINDSGKRQSIVREGGIQTALCLWSEQCANVMEGWAWTDMAAAFGVAPTDKRLDDKARGMSEAIRKLGFVAERYQSYFKVMTVTEVAIKDEYMRRNIEGQIKARTHKSKPLRVRGHEPSGSQNLQMAWWDLPQLEANERGRARD